MTETQEKVDMARRAGDVSILRPWVGTLTIQAQGVLLSALRGPDGAHKDGPAKAIGRALRATLVHNAKEVGPDDVYMGDGTGMCTPDEVDLFFEGVDVFPLHWYHHFVHAVEIVGRTHPNDEIRQFWSAFYEQAVEKLHLSPEPVDVMLQRLRRDGSMVDAGTLGPCPVCGFGRLALVVLTERLRMNLPRAEAGHDRAGLCANCLTPRTTARG
jgi:hypothetical protein